MSTNKPYVQRLQRNTKTAARVSPSREARANASPPDHRIAEALALLAAYIAAAIAVLAHMLWTMATQAGWL